MATTTAPLFGLDASGSLAKSIVFSKWRGRTYVRRHAIPSNPKSGLQVGMRSVFGFVASVWSSLASTIQDDWQTLADATNITLLNASVQYNQRRARQGNLPVRSPDDVAGTTPDAATVTATAGYKQVTVGITPGVNAPEYCWAIYGSTTMGFTPGPDNLVGMVKAADTSFIHTGLTSGTTYYYVVKGGNNDGEAGAASTEQSATPT